MEQVIEQVLYGKIKGINSSDNMFNLLVELPDFSTINIKTKLPGQMFATGRIYKFKVASYPNTERNIRFLLEHCLVCELESSDEVDMAYRLFENKCPYTKKELEERIVEFLNKIENKIIYNITASVLKEHENFFYVYPAAQRFHHNYVGGLASHTLGMLELAKSLGSQFTYLDMDYLYAGVILHDIAKVVEFSGIENTEYTLEGQLLGHLVIGSEWIKAKAKELGYDNKEEVLLLMHMVASHHGQQAFGACKRPQTPEAIMLWYIDTIDSKFRVLGEELARTEPGKFTDSIGVLEKTRVYKKR